MNDVPKKCPGCNHDFHPAGNCCGLEAGRCPCERNMAVHLDIHSPMSETADRAALQRDIAGLWHTNAALLAQVKLLEAERDHYRAHGDADRRAYGGAYRYAY